jgi:hypothetical protein
MSNSSRPLRAGHHGRAVQRAPLTPSKKRAARLIRQALRINVGRIFAALSVRS